MEINIAFHPVGRYFNIAAIYSHRIFFGQQRRHRVTLLELVWVIDIDGCPKTLHFPVAGYFYVFPVSRTHVGVGDIRGQFGVRIYKVELPYAI